MQQSSKAQDQNLSLWFQQIEHGSLKLPRFQRHEAWDRGRITSFLNTIIHNLPVGVTLVLEVGGQEQFVSRFIEGSEPAHPQQVTKHLLDGQQRLTAFWRAMHHDYPDETYFVYMREFDTNPPQTEGAPEREVRCVPRWMKQGNKMPRWADQPAQCLQRGLIPLYLTRPTDIGSDKDNWVNAATQLDMPTTGSDAALAMAQMQKYMEKKQAISDRILELRNQVSNFNLPYLSLPATTSKDVALQVFINMNTNSKPLALYDIIVAEVESVTGKSLHELQEDLLADHPEIARYWNPSNLVLSTSALLQEKLPNERGMVEMGKEELLKNWDKLRLGLARMTSFLEREGIYDAARLPSNAVLAVIAAAYEFIPLDGDRLAKGERLLRRYLWSSFFTDRYENAAASRAFADFKAIKALLSANDFDESALESVPVLNRLDFPLADAESLLTAGWPKNLGIRARAILAVTTLLGARDFADDHPVSVEHVRQREYHHVFPAALLEDAGLVERADLALNCALVTWKTNRRIGRKDPLEYIKERVNLANAEIVKDRLGSHLLSYSRLSAAHYDGLSADALRAKLEPDYQEFLKERADLVVAAMNILVQGQRPSVERVWEVASIP